WWLAGRGLPACHVKKTNGKPDTPGPPRRKSIARAQDPCQCTSAHASPASGVDPPGPGQCHRSRPSLGPTRGAPCASFGDLGAPAKGGAGTALSYSSPDSGPTASAWSAVSPAASPAPTGAARVAISDSVRPLASLRRWVWYASPVPAGISRP